MSNNDNNFTHALVIELDYVALNIREVEFEAIKRGIEPKGIELTLSSFSKSSMSPNHRLAITDVLKAAGNKADAIEKAVSEVDKSVKDYCLNKAYLNKGIIELVKAAKSRNIAVKFYTTLDLDLADNLLEKFGLTDLGVDLINPSEIGYSFPKADDWLKMLKELDLEDKVIISIVSSQVACKGALTSGATCIAVPDRFTSFQDFSGAIFILDDLSDQKPEYLLDHTLRD